MSTLKVPVNAIFRCFPEEVIFTETPQMDFPEEVIFTENPQGTWRWEEVFQIEGLIE